MLGLLAQAGQGDHIYVEHLDERAHWGQDPIQDLSPRMDAYFAAARRGATVRILLNGGRFDADYMQNSESLITSAYANRVARDESLDLRAAVGDPTQYGIHNKMVLVWLDGIGGYAHVGSLNGTETASKTNRELAVQIHSDQVFLYLKRVFDWDWYVSNPLYMPLVTRAWSPPPPPVDYAVISEVLYDPPGVDEGSEWVEIYNPTNQPLDISAWYLGDVGPAGEFGSGLYTFPSGAVLPANGVILVARQAADVIGFIPDYEFIVAPLRNDPSVPDFEILLLSAVV